MAKGAYIGVDGVARKIKKGYIGVPEFVQPVLTADGTLGGSAFAVYASNYHSADYAAYKAFNGKASDGYSSSVNPSSQTIYLTFYNPTAIKVSALKFTNVPYGLTSSSPKAFSVQGSNDNSTWATIGSFTNTNNTNGATWSVNLSGGFYKYHRLVITSANTSEAYVNIAEIAITATMSAGVARKIKKAYIGIGGVAMPFFGGGVEDMAISYNGNYTDQIVTMSNVRYRLLTLTSSGTLTLSEPVSAEVWMCGGGTSGHHSCYSYSGGGGAGAFTATGSVVLSGSMVATIGAGGVSSTTQSANADFGAGSATSVGGLSTSTNFTRTQNHCNCGISGGTGGGKSINGSYSDAGSGDGISKYPFGDTSYFKPHCAGGGAGGTNDNYSGWNGGAGGTNGGNGGNPTYVNDTSQTGGSGGNYGGGTGGAVRDIGAPSTGGNATFYGSGGGGAGGRDGYTSVKTGGAGYQGVIYIRIPVV